MCENFILFFFPNVREFIFQENRSLKKIFHFVIISGTQIPILPTNDDRSHTTYPNHTTTTNHLSYIQPSMDGMAQDIILPADGSELEHCVDRSEFDKYIKYNRSCDTQRMDSNHNYPHHVAPQPNYYQNVDVVNKNEHNFANQTFDQIKSEDDFSVILAGVRKTCYSSWDL